MKVVMSAVFVNSKDGKNRIVDFNVPASLPVSKIAEFVRQGYEIKYE
jgi:hypothetical protein